MWVVVITAGNFDFHMLVNVVLYYRCRPGSNVNHCGLNENCRLTVAEGLAEFYYDQSIGFGPYCKLDRYDLLIIYSCLLINISLMVY